MLIAACCLPPRRPLCRIETLRISRRNVPLPGRILTKMVVAGIPAFLQTNPEYPIAELIGMKTGKTKMNVDPRNS